MRIRGLEVVRVGGGELGGEWKFLEKVSMLIEVMETG
jgi:hypothetical protein